MFRFYLSSIFPFIIPVCPKGSAGQSTHTFLVTWSAHIFMITCLATNNFVLVLTYTVFSSVHFLYFWVWICLNMFYFHVLFICHFSIPVVYNRLIRVIHWYIFSRLAGAQFAGYINCLATNHFILAWTDNCLLASSHLFYIYIHFFLSLNISEHVLFLCLIHLPFHHPSVPPKAQQSDLPTHF